MNKKRNINLDIIRVIALFMVLIYHYEIEVYVNEMKLFSHFFSGFHHINFGGIGVFLFFMLSGAVHAMKYDVEIDIRKYYIKRFLSIFPYFYITWIMGSIIDVVLNEQYILYGRNDWWRIIFTLMGCDGYFPDINTFYLVGEWFTTVIVFIYLIFPILRKVLNEHELTTLFCLLAINIFFISDCWNPLNIVLDGNCFFAISAFSLGYVLYKKKIRFTWKESIAILCIMSSALLLSSKQMQHAILNIIVAIMLFLVIFCGPIQIEKETNNIAMKILLFFSKYSYILYLTHHFVMRRTVAAFKMNATIQNKILCFFITIIGIVFFTIAVEFVHKQCYKLNKYIFGKRIEL